MIVARQLRELDLEGSDASSAPYVSAASGMVVIGDLLYVVADDALHLGVFDLVTAGPGRLVRLLDGELPEAPGERKALKPDFEALVRLPAFHGYPHGALLALPSGSRPNRCRGVALGLDASGRPAGSPKVFDLSGFYLPLQETITGLNVEGAVIVRDQLVLLHRGGKAQPASALAHFSLAELFLAVHAAGDSTHPVVAGKISFVDLGHMAGSRLAFTDGAALPDGRIVFTAVAENTENSYLDGPCVAAAIGIIDQDDRLQTLQRMRPTEKIEGIHVQTGASRLDLLLVTDADDPKVPAKLLAAGMPMP